MDAVLEVHGAYRAFVVSRKKVGGRCPFLPAGVASARVQSLVSMV